MLCPVRIRKNVIGFLRTVRCGIGSLYQRLLHTQLEAKRHDALVIAGLGIRIQVSKICQCGVIDQRGRIREKAVGGRQKRFGQGQRAGSVVHIPASAQTDFLRSIGPIGFQALHIPIGENKRRGIGARFARGKADFASRRVNGCLPEGDTIIRAGIRIPCARQRCDVPAIPVILAMRRVHNRIVQCSRGKGSLRVRLRVGFVPCKGVIPGTGNRVCTDMVAIRRCGVQRYGRTYNIGGSGESRERIGLPICGEPIANIHNICRWFRGIRKVGRNVQIRIGAVSLYTDTRGHTLIGKHHRPGRDGALLRKIGPFSIRRPIMDGGNILNGNITAVFQAIMFDIFFPSVNEFKAFRYNTQSRRHSRFGCLCLCDNSIFHL